MQVPPIPMQEILRAVRARHCLQGNFGAFNDRHSQACGVDRIALRTEAKDPLLPSTQCCC